MHYTGLEIGRQVLKNGYSLIKMVYRNFGNRGNLEMISLKPNYA